MSDIKPFKISVSDDKINRLKQKLALADFPDEVVDEEPWVRGPPLSDIKRLSHRWLNGYDWRKAEADLNKLPQYMTKISIDNFDTYDVHFIHQPSTVKNAIPLVFAHGWPGSFIEVTKILPELVKGGRDYPAFHVVAPSLLDYGFSAASKKKGFYIDQQAEMCHKLMLKLGYPEYVCQGGDLGYGICRTLARVYPDHCKAHHITMAIPNEPTAESHPEIYAEMQKAPLTEWEKAGRARNEWFLKDGFGYFQIQSTRPQTIGYNITDSPVGLLAWIWEKLHDWTDHEHYKWEDDEILTWISIYYFSTAGPAATQRIYYEESHQKPHGSFTEAANYLPVPLGIADFPKELSLTPKIWHKTMGPVVHDSTWDYGGHFSTWERPEAIVQCLREMFGKGGGAEGVVKGASGFE